MNTNTPKLTAAQARVWNQIKDTVLNQTPGTPNTSRPFQLTKWLELYATCGSGINGPTLRVLARVGLIEFTEDFPAYQANFKLTQQGLDDLAAPQDKPAEKLDAEYSTWANTVAGQLPAELADESFVSDMPDTNAEIAGLVDCLRKYAAAAAAIEEQKSALKARLATLLTERGRNWSDEAGYARLSSGGTRVSYDTDALDERIILEPDRYDWLRDLRTQTPVKPYVQVK